MKRNRQDLISCGSLFVINIKYYYITLFEKKKRKKYIFSVAYLINIYYTFVNLKIRENSVRTDAVIRVRKCLICLD